MADTTRSSGKGLPDLFQGLDDLYEGFFTPMRAFGNDWSGRFPAMDVVENDNSYEISAEMPGLKKDDINVTVEDGVLTIAGEKSESTEEKKEGKVIRSERRYGKYLRRMTIGRDIDESKIEAKYEDGILKLTIPKTNGRKETARTIKIH